MFIYLCYMSHIANRARVDSVHGEDDVVVVAAGALGERGEHVPV